MGDLPPWVPLSLYAADPVDLIWIRACNQETKSLRYYYGLGTSSIDVRTIWHTGSLTPLGVVRGEFLYR